MLYVCEMRVGSSIPATTSVKRTSYGHLITTAAAFLRSTPTCGAELVVPERLGDDRRIRSSFCFTPRHSTSKPQRYSYNIAHS